MRTSPLLGPAAGILLLGGLFENNIETSAGDGAISRWLAGSGNTGWMAHAVVMALAGIALVAFAQVARGLLGPDRPDPLGGAVTSFGTLLGTLVVVGAALFATVPVGRFFESAPQPDPSTYRYLSSAAASVLVVFLSLPAAAFAGSVAALGMRHRTAPRWLGITGLVLAVLMVLTAFVAPLVVFGLWLVVTGVGLARSSAPSRVGAVPEPLPAA